MQKASDLGSSTVSQAVDEMLSNKEGNATYELGGMSETIVYKDGSSDELVHRSRR